MSRVQTVRGFINQRLSAAAEEIFELFERTIAEYEEQLCRSKEENERQKKLLEAGSNPQPRLHRADPQQLLVRTEDVPPEQLEWSPSLSQEDPTEPAHVKEEQEELWSSQERELEEEEEEEEDDIIKFIFTPVPDCHVEDPGRTTLESSQLHENHREANRDSEDLMDEAEGQSGGSSESDGLLKSVFHEEGGQSEPGLKTLSCRVCGKRYHKKRSLASHMRLHSEGHFFSCLFCEKTFPWRRDVLNHMRVHTGEKPFGCSFCGATFAQNSHLTLHLRVHTGEKPYTCSVCNASFSVRKTLHDHMTVHTGEKPHNCSVCGKRFSQSGALRRHMAIHTGVKRFYCGACERQFARMEHVKKHKCVGESSRDAR